MELPNIAAYAYQDVHVWSALLTCLRPLSVLKEPRVLAAWCTNLVPLPGDLHNTRASWITQSKGPSKGRLLPAKS